MSKLQAYIAALAQNTGLPLESSPDQSFLAQLGSRRLLVKELEDGSALLFYVEVGRPAVFRRDATLAALMGYNLFLGETRGAALSYDAASEMVGLNLILPLRQLENAEFVNAVENMVTEAESWGRKLEELNAQAEDQAIKAGRELVIEDGDAAGPAADLNQIIRG